MRWEQTGRRSLIYSRWHRLYLGPDEAMIDVDAAEYCRRCSKVLALVETARDTGRPKSATVLGQLARQAGVLALCVLYTIADPLDEEHGGCRCEPNRADSDCPHGIIRFRVKKLWPDPQRLFVVMSPEEFRDRLRTLRMHHISDEHSAWEVGA